MDQQTVYERERPVSRENGLSARGAPEEKVVTDAAIGGSSLGVIGGAGAAVLAIIGLAGAFPFLMTAIATIAIGAGLFVEGSSLGAALSRFDHDPTSRENEAAGGFALQGVAGAGGIVLGILSLIGIFPMVLIPIAIITIGGAMAFGGPARAELNLTVLEMRGASRTARRAATQAVNASSGLLTLVGLGGVTLGILALVGVTPVGTLVLVALLGLGGALFLGDSSLLGRAGMGRMNGVRKHAF